MTKQTAATAIVNAKVHAHKASMRSSADLCIATAEERFVNGKLQYYGAPATVRCEDVPLRVFRR